MATSNLRGVSPAGCLAGGAIVKDRLVKLSTTANNTVLEATASTGDVYGVALAAAATGEPVAVQQTGKARVVAGAAITAGDQLMWATGGKVVTATGTNTVLGVALEAALADGDVIEAEINCPAFQAP